MSYGSASFRESTPYTFKRMNEDALTKRARCILKPPAQSDEISRDRWHMIAIRVATTVTTPEEFHSMYSSREEEDNVTIDFTCGLTSTIFSKTINYYASIAKDDLPLLTCLTYPATTTTTSSSSSSSMMAMRTPAITTMTMLRRHYAIMQAIGFSCFFEMSNVNLQRKTEFKTAPLAPVFMRMLLMSTETVDKIVDKWRVYGVVRTLTSWVSRRLFDKSLDIHSMLHNTDSPYFVEHYRRLPRILDIMFTHVKRKQPAFIKFLDQGMIGYTMLYVFFAPQQMNRIHHRLISEARYIEEHICETIREDYPEFYDLVDKLKTWSQYDEFCNQNLVFISKYDYRWTIDQHELHMQTYKIACDPRLPENIAMALMLSLIASSRDDGQTVQYLEKLFTPYYMIKRIEDIIKVKQRDRPKREHLTIAAQVYADVATTNIYAADLVDSTTIYRSRIQAVHKWIGKLGCHDLVSTASYTLMMKELPTLYTQVERPCELGIPTTALDCFIVHLDNYYNNSQNQHQPTFDAYVQGMAADRLLPLSNLNLYLDRVFFYL